MKGNPAQARTAIAAARGDVRFFLLHGADEAGARALSATLGQTLGAEAERVDFDGAMLKADPARLADEAASLSLFGGKRWIRVTGIGDESVAAVEALLASPAVANPVVAIGPALRSTSKLVKLALAAPTAMACAMYVPDGRAAESLAGDIAREHGLRPVATATARLVEASGGDRAVMTREIEKLALYLDAAPDAPRDLDDAAIDAVGADLGEAGMFDAVAAAVEGRTADLGRELARLSEGGTSYIPVTRQLVRRLMALAEAKNAGGGAARGYDRDAESTARAIGRWTPAMLATAIDRVRAAERAVMAPGTPGDIVAAHAVLDIARAAARRR